MNDFEWTVQMRFAVALALGLLVGLERERRRIESHMVLPAGVRTFTIISLFGFACAWLHQQGVPAALPVGMVAVAALCVTGYLAKLRDGRTGWTSEIAALLTFAVGALALIGQVWMAAALGIVNTLLLSEKVEIETSVEFLDRAEFLAVLKFLIVTLIILPALPDKEYTQFLLNPRTIWRVVVLVSTVGFVGYLLARHLGARVGLWLSGLLGGIVSSTAVAVSMGRIARQSPGQAGNALRASMLSSCMTYVRLLVLLWIVAPAFVPRTWLPLLLLAAVGMMLSLRLPGPSAVEPDNHLPTLKNPFELRYAVAFAGLFVALGVLTHLVHHDLGIRSLYALAALTGLTDVTPFMMSLALQPAGLEHALPPLLVVALMTNTVTKGAYFAALGGALQTQTYTRYGVWAALHAPVVWWLVM